MLVLKVESEYFKKATGKTNFSCDDGQLIRETIDKAIKVREPQTIRARSVGKNNEGAIVAEFFITWSFKVKK